MRHHPDRRTAVALAFSGLFLVPGLPGQVQAQSIMGRVSSVPGGGPVAAAEVVILGADGSTSSMSTGPEGRFRLELPAPGSFFLSVSALGYVARDSLAVEVGPGEEVEVSVELSTSPVELPGLEVVARGLALRHRATLGGFRHRHLDAPSVGTRRLFDRNDPEVRTAFDIGDVMKWLPVTRRMCFDVFVDGLRRPGWDDFRLAAVEGIEGVEFYADPLDAPIEFRDGGRCAILAIWRREVGSSGIRRSPSLGQKRPSWPDGRHVS